MKQKYQFLRILLPMLLLVVPFVVLADDSASILPNPISANNLTDLIINVTRALIGFVALAATFMFIYGGVMMLISGGNVEQVKKSKAVLKYTTISLIVLFLTAVILRFVFDVLSPGSYDPSIAAQLNLPSADLGSTTAKIVLTILGLLGIAATAMMVYGGYTWLTAGGNEKRVEKAKQILYAAVIGLVIILMSWAIIRFVVFTTANVAK